MSNNNNAFATISKKLCGVVFAVSVAMIGNSALAQVFEETVPTKPTAAAFEMPTIKEVEKVDVAKLNMADIANEDLIRAARVEAPRYAIPNAVNISPTTSGTWENVIDQAGALRSVWRLRVGCDNAVSMNLGFTEYHLPRGAALYIYTPDFAHVIRPFTEADNADHGQLWTPPLPGNEIVIELTVERDLEREVQLTLGSINAGYLNFSEIANAIDKSGSCNVDVVCSQGDGWRDEISTVAAISTGGSLFCTGFMVNNVRQDLAPYFMTAYHCGVTASNAASLVAFWNYENTTCRTPGSSASSGTGDGVLTKFNTGSTFKAGSSASDFTLVRLSSSPNAAWYVNFAGWNATGAEATASCGIHHPNVQEKRISFDTNASTTTSYSGTTSPGDGTHVRVGQWEVGTTEGGSSGSPIFNQLHQVIGQLHGGSASCTSITSDYYGKFSVSWNGGGTAATALKTWLDPDNTGTLSVNTLSTKGLTVTPSTAVTHSGLVGGPFSSIPYTYTLSNSTAVAVNYRVALTNNIGLLINGGTSNLTGSVPAAGSVVVTVTAGSALTSSAAGIYAEDIVFTDLGTGVARTVRHTVEIGQTGFTATPATGLSTGGAVGGPFAGSVTYTVTNSKSAPVTVNVSADASWISIDGSTAPTSFTLTTAGATRNVTVAIAAGANSLAAGIYSGNVTFAKSDGTTPTTRSVALDVGRTVYSATDCPITVGDNTTNYSYITVYDNVCIADVDVNVNISHTYIGDLYVELLSPSGTTVILHNRTGTGTDNIVATYDDDGGGTLPSGALSDFDFSQSAGVWRLRVSDQASTDTGVLNSWSLRIGAVAGPCPVQTVVYSEPLNSNPGWTSTGLWAFGTPVGTAVTTGGADPKAGFTGTNVYGYNNVGTGVYENSLVERNLTTTAFNCTGLTGVKVGFQRWLNVESSTYDHAYFKISTDGTNWTTLYQNSASVSSTSWSKVSYNISAIADNQPTVYLRWVMGTTDSSVQYTGWNVDDLEVSAVVTATPCPADLNGDSVVDAEDLGTMLGGFGDCTVTPCLGDLNADSVIDAEDLGSMLGQFGNCP